MGLRIEMLCGIVGTLCAPKPPVITSFWQCHAVHQALVWFGARDENIALMCCEWIAFTAHNGGAAGKGILRYFGTHFAKHATTHPSNLRLRH